MLFFLGRDEERASWKNKERAGEEEKDGWSRGKKIGKEGETGEKSRAGKEKEQIRHRWKGKRCREKAKEGGQLKGKERRYEREPERDRESEKG